jgi:hypothetical protein
MHNENQFLSELANVPPVPDEAFSEINRIIKRKNSRRQLFFAIAASMVLMTGISSYFFSSSLTEKTALKTEVTDELQIARDFINGDDIDNDYNQYSFLDTNDL